MGREGRAGDMGDVGREKLFVCGVLFSRGDRSEKVGIYGINREMGEG